MIIRYLFEGEVYRLNITDDARQRCWWVESCGESIFIKKGKDVHVASVMADVDHVIRERKANEARANDGGLYNMLTAFSPVTRFGCL